MHDENVAPDVSEQMTEAAEAHEETAQQQGSEAWGGEGNQPEGTGYAAPDTGQGDSAESEIPVGVDSIEPVEGAADDGGSAPLDLANLDTGDDGDDGGDEPAAEAAVDVSDAVEAPAAEEDAEPAEAEAEAEAPDTAEDAAEAEPPDTAEAEAEAAPDTAEASAEPAGDDDEPVGDPDKFSGGGDIGLAGTAPQSAAEAAGAVPTEFRTPPGIPSGLDPGRPEDRDQRV